MTGAIEDIGEAVPPTAYVAELYSVLEGVEFGRAPDLAKPGLPAILKSRANGQFSSKSAADRRHESAAGAEVSAPL